MYSVGVVEMIVLLILLLWIAVLSYFFGKQKKFLDQLFPKTGGDVTNQDSVVLIRDHFNKLLEAVEEVQKREKGLKVQFRNLAKDGLKHTQRVGILRYNPYDDTGGDQSFSLALLDGSLNGFILTSLHSRTSTRVYTKIVKMGKSDLDLSREEKEVLKEAVEDQ